MNTRIKRLKKELKENSNEEHNNALWEHDRAHSNTPMLLFSRIRKQHHIFQEWS